MDATHFLLHLSFCGCCTLEITAGCLSSVTAGSDSHLLLATYWHGPFVCVWSFLSCAPGKKKSFLVLVQAISIESRLIHLDPAPCADGELALSLCCWLLPPRCLPCSLSCRWVSWGGSHHGIPGLEGGRSFSPISLYSSLLWSAKCGSLPTQTMVCFYSFFMEQKEVEIAWGFQLQFYVCMQHIVLWAMLFRSSCHFGCPCFQSLLYR